MRYTLPSFWAVSLNVSQTLPLRTQKSSVIYRYSEFDIGIVSFGNEKAGDIKQRFNPLITHLSSFSACPRNGIRPDGQGMCLQFHETYDSTTSILRARTSPTTKEISKMICQAAQFDRASTACNRTLSIMSQRAKADFFF